MDTIRVRLSGKTLLARAWDAGIEMTAEMRAKEPLHAALGDALNDAKHVKSGKGYSVIFAVGRSAAEYLLKDLKDWAQLFASDNEPESTTDAQALRRDVERLERLLSGDLPKTTYGYGKRGYYVEEHRIFTRNYVRHILNHDALLLTKKILRHFKVSLNVRYAKTAHDGYDGYVSVCFKGNWNKGRVRYVQTRNPVIHIGENPSVGLLAHEVAHVIAARHGEYKDNTLNFDKWNSLVQHWVENHKWVEKVSKNPLGE